MVSALSDAVDTVEGEVASWCAGLDSVEDRLVMRRLIDEVVTDYDERALTSTMPPRPDPASAARGVRRRRRLPQQCPPRAPEVEEVWSKLRLSDGSRCLART